MITSKTGLFIASRFRRRKKPPNADFANADNTLDTATKTHQ